MQIRLKVLLVVIVSLIIVVASYSILTFTVQIPEESLWMFQSTFYAFMTALFGFIFGVLILLVRDFLEEQKNKKIEEKRTLESLKREYDRCAWSIQNNMEKYIEKNELSDSEVCLYDLHDFPQVKILEELRMQVQEYNEKGKDYNIFLKMSKRSIEETIKKTIEKMFPKTLEKYDEFPTMLYTQLFMEKYVRGEKVTANWLKDTHPIALKNITKEIDETERHELDVYFNEINNMFEEDEVLKRFIKAKEELIKCGQEIIKVLKKKSEPLPLSRFL